jgi:hypothetical protein
MSTWYKANRWSNSITTVDVTKETDKFITIVMTSYYKGTTRRVMKSDEYFPTFREAKESLQGHWVRERESAKRDIEAADRKWTKLFHQDEPDKEKQ